MHGRLNAIPNVPMSCHAECLVGKWLIGDGGKQCKDVELLNSLCLCCDSFFEAASQAVLMVNMKETETAKAALQDGRMFSESSKVFQEYLVKLHTGIV